MTTQLVSDLVSTYIPTKKIMIVEDESVISLDIKNSLTRLGYEIAGIAASGDDALAKIQSSRPDLILMDIHLKGAISGIEVSRKVKENFQIPIVYLTANADSRTFKEANQTDPYGYLIKPFVERELEIAIEIALHKHEQEQIIRSSERWYATAFQLLSEAVIATDQQGDVVFMNALAESITGWALTEAIDRPIIDILTFRRKIQQPDTIDGSNSVSRILEATLGAATGGIDLVPLPHQAQLLTKSLEIVPVEGQAIAIRDTTGYITGSLFTFRTVLETAETANPTTTTAGKSTNKSAGRLAGNLENSALDQAKQSIDQREIGCIKTFIEAFIRQQPTSFASGDLVASHDKEATTLTSRTEGNIITSKLVRESPTAIVNRRSIYWEIACHILIENSFFPVSQRTNGTCHFQHCTIPKDCQVYRTSAQELWEVWHGKACPNGNHPTTMGLKVSRANIMVLRRGSWYHIQSLSLANDIVKIKTIAGELFTSTGNLLVWGTHLW
ncbi:MAG: response regulator [Cyanobacteria bacterium P01_D01_bin.1]